jgi:hypothetical protein
MAGIGFSIKPHFVIIWVLLELYLIIDDRNYKCFFRHVNMVIIVIFILYGISGIYWFNDYFHLTKLAHESYSAYNSTITKIIQNHAMKLWLASLLVFLIMSGLRYNNKILKIIFIGATSSIIIVLIQYKGWNYHFYPAVLFTTIFLTLSIPILVYKMGTLASINYVKKMIMVIITAGLVFIWSVEKPIINPKHDENHYIEYFSKYIKDHSNGENIFIFSSSVYPSFPIVNYSNVQWASRFNCLWLIPGSYTDENELHKNIIYNTINQMSIPEYYMYNAVVNDLRDNKPYILLFDNKRYKQGFGEAHFDFKDYFIRDPRFAQFMENYIYFDNRWGFEIYKKIEGINE